MAIKLICIGKAILGTHARVRSRNVLWENGSCSIEHPTHSSRAVLEGHSVQNIFTVCEVFLFSKR